jgi:hypothetical protein
VCARVCACLFVQEYRRLFDFELFNVKLWRASVRFYVRVCLFVCVRRKPFDFEFFKVILWRACVCCSCFLCVLGNLRVLHIHSWLFLCVCSEFCVSGNTYAYTSIFACTYIYLYIHTYITYQSHISKITDVPLNRLFFDDPEDEQ